MLSGHNSTNQISTALIRQKTKRLSRQQQRANLTDIFVRYTLSTSRLPHTYLPNLDVYEFFTDKSIDSIYQIPQQLIVQVFSYLFCIAGNEVRETSLHAITNYLLRLFRNYYQGYIVSDEFESQPSVNKTVDFVVMVEAKSLTMQTLFQKKYPGAKDRLLYFFEFFHRAYQDNYFPAPYSIFAVQINNAEQIKILRAMLQYLVREDYPRYVAIKKFIYDNYGVTERDEEIVELAEDELHMPDDDEPYAYAEIPEPHDAGDVDVVMETSLRLNSEPTSPTNIRKRSSTAVDFFGDSKRVSPSLASTGSSVNLVDQAQNGTMTMVKRK
jgi:hypothetical protein